MMSTGAAALRNYVIAATACTMRAATMIHLFSLENSICFEKVVHTFYLILTNFDKILNTSQNAN
jgi:hypothetical protein